MDHFNYRNGQLYAEDVPVADIAAEFGTPAYVYSRATLERHYRAYDDALKDHAHLVCYAVKANSNLAVLNVLARLGAGFDIVSAGELERVLRAGGDPARVVFSGVGKQPWEMKRALEAGVRCFNVESDTELDRLNAVAGELGTRAPVSLRVNPDVDAGTHPYLHRPERKQIRHRHHRSASRVRAGGGHVQPGRDRRGLPHRFAADHHGTVPRCAGPGVGVD